MASLSSFFDSGEETIRIASPARRERGIYSFIEPRRISLNDFRLDSNGFLVRGVGEPVSSPYIGTGSRKWFRLPEDDFTCFRLCRAFKSENHRQEVFFYHGWRLIVEYYDTNVILELGCRIDSGAPERDTVLALLSDFFGEKVHQVVPETGMINIVKETPIVEIV